MKCPRLRQDLQLVPATAEGRQVLLFVDPLQLAVSGLTVEMELLPLLQLLDGRHDLKDLQMEIMRQQGGELVPLSDIESFINNLDGNFLLESDFFREKFGTLFEEFAGQADRAPFHAGRSYEAHPERLRMMIDETEERLVPPAGAGRDSTITGILAPHIDIGVAKELYVDLYRRLRGRTYDLVIILGINHQGQNGLYSVSTKNYVTPFGKLETDGGLIGRLKDLVPAGTLATHDFGHKMEHSIEFQTLFLHHYLGGTTPVVPILCGSIYEFLMTGADLFADARFRGMVDALRLIMMERTSVLVVAGVDFSHVGLKFGDQLPADVLIEKARAHDEKIITSLVEGAPETIFRDELETEGRFNVCGIPAMLLLSSLLGKGSAEVLAHETYDEQVTQSAVTYAGMIFTG